MDRNDVYLQGWVSGEIKYAKAGNGRNYAAFTLVIEPPAYMMQRGSKSRTLVPIKVFDSKVLEKMRNLKLRAGSRVCIVGFLNSYMAEKRGVEYLVSSTIVRTLEIVKTTPEEIPDMRYINGDFTDIEELIKDSVI